MKKIFSSFVGTTMLLMLLIASPIIVTYGVYGKTQNGYTILRYPHFTEVIVGGNQPGFVTLFGKDDCTPDYKLVTVSNGRFLGAQKLPLTPEDRKNWEDAMKTD